MTVGFDILSDVNMVLKEMENQNHKDRAETLTLLLKKYMHNNSCELLIGEAELNETIMNASSILIRKSFPIFLGSKKSRVRQDDQAKLCLLESFISVLNKKNCFKRLPKFDYQEDSFKED